MSNYRGGRQGGRGNYNGSRDHGGSNMGPNHMNRMNDSFNQGMSQNRMNPWDVNPGNNRPSGGLLPTPNMPAMGLLQTPSMQDVQLANVANVLNLLLPNLQNQQTNQMPSLLGARPNSNNGLLPLSPPTMNPFQNQNFRDQGNQGCHQDNLGSGPNRVARPNMQSRRVEPYNKMGNRNQRPGGDDRKPLNVSPRRPVRGPGLSPKNVVQQTRNIKEEKEDSKKNQKNDNTVKEIDDKDKRLNDKQENDKIKADYADIPGDLLRCHVCDKSLGNPIYFVNHVKGKAHQSAMERQEEQYKVHTEKLRQNMRVEEQQRQISQGQNNRHGRVSQPNEYCTMCNLNFNGNLTQHRKSAKHQQLKSFLHPRCTGCDKEFATRIDYDHHLLTVGHIKTANKTKKEAGNEDKKSSKQQDGNVSQDRNQKTVGDNSGGTVVKKGILKKPSSSFNSNTQTIAKTEVKKSDSGSSRSVESDKDKLPDYDSQKEIGMEMLQEKTGYLCLCCNRFLSSSSDAHIHCRSQFHYDKYIAHMKSQPIVVKSPVKSPKLNGSEKSPCTKIKTEVNDAVDEGKKKVQDKVDVTKSEEDDQSDVVKTKEGKQDAEPEEEEEDEEDEGNWKRRKISKEDDLSMDTTNPSKKEEPTNEGGEVIEPASKDEDKKPSDETGEDANSTVINEDLEKTLLLEDV